MIERKITMTKTELIAGIAEVAGLSKADAERALGAFVSVVTDALKGGEEVRMLGFGTFSTTKRAATIGRNPKTGESISIPAKTSPRFKTGQRLKGAVAG
jgi:DNA-binding protein HU-beta